MEELKEYLTEQGWLFRGGVFVRFSNPRLGWRPEDGTMIIGYHERAGKVTTVAQMKEVLAGLDGCGPIS